MGQSVLVQTDLPVMFGGRCPSEPQVSGALSPENDEEDVPESLYLGGVFLGLVVSFGLGNGFCCCLASMLHGICSSSFLVADTSSTFKVTYININYEFCLNFNGRLGQDFPNMTQGFISKMKSKQSIQETSRRHRKTQKKKSTKTNKKKTQSFYCGSKTTKTTTNSLLASTALVRYDLMHERLSQGTDIEKRLVEKIRISFQQFLRLGSGWDWEQMMRCAGVFCV